MSATSFRSSALWRRIDGGYYRLFCNYVLDAQCCHVYRPLAAPNCGARSVYMGQYV
jgi:hypothetical protein